MRRIFTLFGLLALCQLASAAATLAATTAHVHTIAIDLDIPAVTTGFGKSSGYAPMVAKVRVGDRIRFINVDDESHTATALSVKDFKPHGDRLSRPWSTGSLAEEQISRLFLADKPGIYHYLCRYHVAHGQQAVIVVSP